MGRHRFVGTRRVDPYGHLPRGTDVDRSRPVRLGTPRARGRRTRTGRQPCAGPRPSDDAGIAHHQRRHARWQTRCRIESPSFQTKAGRIPAFVAPPPGTALISTDRLLNRVPKKRDPNDARATPHADGGGMDDKPLWWRRPMLREDYDETRRASWLELFVDLMFVAIISACARGLALDVTL